MEYEKDFEKWHKLKKILDELDLILFCAEKEIWWAALGTNVGTEIDGKGDEFARPVLIVRMFNARHILAIPLTKTRNTRPDTHVRIAHRYLSENSFAAINQVQIISNQRLLKLIGTLDDQQFGYVIDTLVTSIVKARKTKPNI